MHIYELQFYRALPIVASFVSAAFFSVYSMNHFLELLFLNKINVISFTGMSKMPRDHWERWWLQSYGLSKPELQSWVLLGLSGSMGTTRLSLVRITSSHACYVESFVLVSAGNVRTGDDFFHLFFFLLLFFATLKWQLRFLTSSIITCLVFFFNGPKRCRD